MMVALGDRFPEVATVNLNDVRSMRSNFIARSYQASSTPTVARVEVQLWFGSTLAFLLVPGSEKPTNVFLRCFEPVKGILS